MQDEAYSEIQVGGHRANSPRFVALVDVADAEIVGAYRWSMGGDGYVVRNTPRVVGKRLAVRMHRAILGLTPGDGVQVDHINGNPLDNRRANLRVATNAQNTQNLHQGGLYRGTSWHAGRWRAHVALAGKHHHLGRFDTREEAAAAASAFRREHMPFSADARSGRKPDITPAPTAMLPQQNPHRWMNY